MKRKILFICGLMAAVGVGGYLYYPTFVDAQNSTPRPGTFAYYLQFVSKRTTSNMQLNEMITLDCASQVLVTRRVDSNTVEVVCAQRTPTGSVVPSPSQSAASTSPRATASAAVVTPSPSPSHSAHSSNTPTGNVPADWSKHMGQWVPNPKWDTCSKEFHDSFNVVGPDGKRYPTWHPPAAVDPATGRECTFGHEHGADPRTSRADSSMPAFGYAAEQMGMIEPHAGFKVAIINKGESFTEGKYAPANYRVVFHMGTAGTKRYVERFHSFEYDYVANDGTNRYFNIYGMGDTGNGTGSTCGGDQNTTSNKGPRDGGRDFSTVGCDDPYEIWNAVSFTIKRPNAQFPDELLQNELGVVFSMAVFDPITTRDPKDNARLLFSQNYYNPAVTTDPTSPQGQFQGCEREVYGGPNYFKNAGRSAVYYTDVYGVIKSGPGPGLIKQEVSTVNSTSNEQFKFRQDFCGKGIHAPN
jgi:hypothetical protein